MRCLTWKLDFVSNILSIIVGGFTKHMNMTVASTNQLPTEKKSLFTELWLSWKKNTLNQLPLSKLTLLRTVYFF